MNTTVETTSRRDEARVILAQQHRQWLESAVTKQAIKLIEAEVEKLRAFVCRKATSADVTDAQLRLYLAQFEVLTGVRDVLSSSDQFATTLVK